MFTKVLIANRSGRAAGAVAAEAYCLVREAQAGDFNPMETCRV